MAIRPKSDGMNTVRDSVLAGIVMSLADRIIACSIRSSVSVSCDTIVVRLDSVGLQSMENGAKGSGTIVHSMGNIRQMKI